MYGLAAFIARFTSGLIDMLIAGLLAYKHLMRVLASQSNRPELQDAIKPSAPLLRFDSTGSLPPLDDLIEKRDKLNHIIDHYDEIKSALTVIDEK